jgi:hypothetical protein
VPAGGTVGEDGRDPGHDPHQAILPLYLV